MSGAADARVDTPARRAWRRLRRRKGAMVGLVVLALLIAVALLARQIGDMAPAGAAGAGHAKTQPQRARRLLDEALHAGEGGRGQVDGHGRTTPVAGRQL